MKRLFLLRHGKAEPQVDGGDDHARRLTARGIRDSEAMGAWLTAQGYKPAMLLCSSSARTRETLSEMLKGLGGNPPVTFMDGMYLASAGKLLGFIQDAPNGADSVLLVGHNPGMEELATRLTTEKLSGKARSWLDALEEKFPTAALAILEFDVAHWSDVKPGEGALKAFLRPKDL